MIFINIHKTLLEGAAMKQYAAIAQIPGRVLANWPSFFTFGLVNYVSGMLLSAVPNLGGYAGLVERAAIGGARDVITMVTWEATKTA